MEKQTKQDLFGEVNRLLNRRPKPGLLREIEVRIGNFKNDRFISDVGARDFYRVLEFFLEQTPDRFRYVSQDVTLKTKDHVTPAISAQLPTSPDIITEYAYDQGREKLRESYIDLKDHPTPKFYSTKRNTGKVDFPDHFVRIGMAEEQNIKTVHSGGVSPVTPDMKPNSLRIKERWAFQTDDKTDPFYPFRIELTHVTGWYSGRDGQQRPADTHEIEMELVHSDVRDSQRQMWPGIELMLRIVQNTRFPVTAATLRGVTVGFNSLFPKDVQTHEQNMRKRNKNWSFNNTQLIDVTEKPANLKMHHLEEAGSLAVTDKADGERRMMYIRNDGAYLLYPPTNIMRYLRLPVQGYEDTHYIDPDIAKKFNGTVFDGELVTRQDGVREYLAFDILVDRGTDVRSQSFENRIDLVHSLITRNNIPITPKKFYLPRDGNFFENVNQIFEEIPNKPYGNDGFIANRIEDPYQKGRVYKWKPPEQLTIDFDVRSLGDDRFELFSKEGTDKKMFAGTSAYPNSGVMHVPNSEVNGAPIATGQIVEVTWNSEKNDFVPFRIRYDRKFPNKLSTAVDVWKDIMEPITEETVRGRNLKTMRKFHNDIKKGMLSDNCKNALIVDIGSGKGGDILKWQYLGTETKLLAIEPSLVYQGEMCSRLEKFGYKKIVDSEGFCKYKDSKSALLISALNAEGQDSQKILDTLEREYQSKADCINMFNVLTFFFDSESSLDSLIKTITDTLKFEGRFLGLVMDGTAVKRAMIKHLDLKDSINSLEPGYYWNLDTKQPISQSSASDYITNNTYNIASRNPKVVRKVALQLEEPDLDELRGSSWYIKKDSEFTSNPYGNRIRVDLGDDTIVNSQTEYLVDFEELVRKLAEHGITLKSTGMLGGSDLLSESQQRLNDFYRSFVFVREYTPKSPDTTPPTEESPVRSSPVKESPVSSSPVKDSLVKSSPVKDSLVKSSPVKDSPTDSDTITVRPLLGPSSKRLEEKKLALNTAKKNLERATVDKTTVKDKLNKFNSKIIDMKNNNVEITRQKARELTSTRNQFKKDLEIAESTISANGITIGLLAQEIKMLEDELSSKTKPQKLTLKKKKVVKKVVKKVKTPTPEPTPEKSPIEFSPEEDDDELMKELEKALNEPTPDKFVGKPECDLLEEEERRDIDVDGTDFVRVGVKDGKLISAILRSKFDSYILGQNASDLQNLTEPQKASRAKAIDRITKLYDGYKEKQPKTRPIDIAGKLIKANIYVIGNDGFISKTNLPRETTIVLYKSKGKYDTVGRLDGNGGLVTEFKMGDLNIKTMGDTPPKHETPTLPKRPKSAYFIFMDEFRSTYKKDNPNVKSVAKIAEAGGKAWNELSPEEKKPYEEKAAKLKEQYDIDLARYKEHQSN